MNSNTKHMLSIGCSSKWLNKLTGEVVYIPLGIDFGCLNKNWFEIPDGAIYATYSNNKVRSDVLLFWKDTVNIYDRSENKIMYDPTGSCEWTVSGSNDITDFLENSSYKGEIIWSLYK